MLNHSNPFTHKWAIINPLALSSLREGRSSVARFHCRRISTLVRSAAGEVRVTETILDVFIMSLIHAGTKKSGISHLRFDDFRHDGTLNV